jgi:hypothetical protein
VTDSLLDALRGRQLPTTTTRIPRDPVAYSALVEELSAALRAVNAAGRATPDSTQRVEAAQAAIDDAPAVEVTIRAIPPDVWEQLVDQHPPTDEQRAAGEEWNKASMRAPLLAVTVVPPEGQDPITADQWDAMVKAGNIGAGELDVLYLTAVTINRRVLRMAPGKG